MLQSPRRRPRNTRLFRIIATLLVAGSLVALLAYGPARMLRLLDAALQKQKQKAVTQSGGGGAAGSTNGGRIKPKSLPANGKIAFTSDRDGNREIYVMNADGTNQTRLTNNPAVDQLPT